MTNPHTKREAQIGQIARVHADARRTVDELNLAHGAHVVQYCVTDASTPLGCDFHKMRDETFVIVIGSGSVVLQHVDDGSQPIDDRVVYDITQGSVVYIPRYCAHRFDLAVGTQMIGFATRAFDETDVHPFEM